MVLSFCSVHIGFRCGHQKLTLLKAAVVVDVIVVLPDVVDHITFSCGQKIFI